MFGSKIIVIYLYEDYSYNRKLKRIIRHDFSIFYSRDIYSY